MVAVRGNAIDIETRTLVGRIENGWITLLRSKANGAERVRCHAMGSSPLQLVYPGQSPLDVLDRLAGRVSCHQRSPRRAEVRLHGWDADGVIAVSEDETTGDLVIEPSAYSSRAGVLSCRWLTPGIAADLELIAPFFQGVRLPLSDPLLQGRWFWPQFWEAGLAILQGRGGGFWIHCQDSRYRYKALNVENGVLGFETEAYGPVERSRGAGGLQWRVNVYDGEWRVPASAYRDWLWEAYGLAAEERARKPWVGDVRFAVSWYGGDLELLDALAGRLSPHQVLLHYSNWRTDAYDENYPTYDPSPAACDAFAKARKMGFHVMPHCNSVDMDPTNAAYHYLRDFQYRDVQTKRLLGWGWDPDSGRVLGVPDSYASLAENRRRKVMVKVHPGLAMWRSILAESVGRAVELVGTDCVFIDVTLCSHNLDNCLVEDTTSSEGMGRLISEIGGLGNGLAVGGEGLNEVTMQGLSFAQAHLYRSWQSNVDGLERTGRCPLNAFLFDRLCRTFGYSGLGGRTENEELRMEVHHQLGAIPTVTVSHAEEIRSPNRAVARALDRALGS